jgi:hypothetical protein
MLHIPKAFENPEPFNIHIKLSRKQYILSPNKIQGTLLRLVLQDLVSRLKHPMKKNSLLVGPIKEHA